MGEQSEASIVLELADVVNKLTRRHGALLDCLRSLRAGFSDGAISNSDQPRSPRALRLPPSPVSAALTSGPVVVTLPRDPGENTRPEAEASPILAAVTEITDKRDMHLTTRLTYDFFAELDDLLARLPAAPSRHEAFPRTNL
jgi:hypothetical protein